MTRSRREFLKGAGALSLYPLLDDASAGAAPTTAPSVQRVRPWDPDWPSAASWERLRAGLKGELIEVDSPLKACAATPGSCDELFRELKNPYFIGDHVALTQTLGWADAWTSEPSVYAVAAENAEDVAAAVNFARENKLRLAIKGGGHSYFGNSNAPDSLLIWTRRMNSIELHEAFVGEGCDGRIAPKPAVSIGAGAIWMHVYNAVMTKAGRYVQGGGCATVGVAGLIQSGGFGSFSKNFGTAAGGLLEAEVVTADGEVRRANPCTNPDLFWGLKGGGGGSLGVVTRLTLQTHDLPEWFGGVFATIKASNDAAFRGLIARMMDFYSDHLLNPHWGEKVTMRANLSLEIGMVFQGIDEAEARSVWRPMWEWVEQSSDLSFEAPPKYLALPARHFFDPATLKSTPGTVIADDRTDAAPENVFWSGDRAEAGQFLNAYQSAWLPGSLLQKDQRIRLVDALYAAARDYGVSLHFNKGLMGAPKDAVMRSRETAMNPVAIDAFALAIIASHAEPSYPGIAGHEPDLTAAREGADAVERAMAKIYRLVPKSYAGAYVSESDYFDKDWQQSYWGSNYPRLLAIKKRYDPDGLFFVHNGVGSEEWSRDGFTRDV